MTESEHPEPDEQPEKTRPVLKKPDRGSEKAISLEMAKLFGLPPQLLVTRPKPPAGQPKRDDEESADSGGEKAEDGG